MEIYAKNEKKNLKMWKQVYFVPDYNNKFSIMLIIFKIYLTI